MPTVPLLASLADLSASQIAGAASQLVPSGVVMPFAGATAPSGWLLCEGALVSRTTYANLFAAISTAHGSGDGSTTFALPNYAGRFLRGRANGSANDPDRASRTAAATGGSTGDAVGSVQANAAARPTTGFTGTAATGGSHEHRLSAASGTLNVAIANSFVATGSANSLGTYGGSLPGGWTELRAGSNFNGIDSSHSHTVSITAGGDNETRPVNAYVNYIIKI